MPLRGGFAPEGKTGRFLYATLPNGEPGLISPQEQAKRKAIMEKICTQCHAKDYVENQFKLLDEAIKETNLATLKATVLLLKAWQSGLAHVDFKKPETMFDEYFEKLWVESWLFYSNSIRYGVAMNGQDWTTFKRGWYRLTEDLAQMQMLLDLYNKAAAK